MDTYGPEDEEEKKEDKKQPQSSPTPETDENDQFEARKRAFKSIRNAFGRQ